MTTTDHNLSSVAIRIRAHAAIHLAQSHIETKAMDNPSRESCFRQAASLASYAESLMRIANEMDLAACVNSPPVAAASPADVEAVATGDTTAWALDGPTWMRRKRGMTLRVFMPKIPLGDGDAQWLCEVYPGSLSADAPRLVSRAELPAEEARAWCDRWADHILRVVVGR